MDFLLGPALHDLGHDEREVSQRSRNLAGAHPSRSVRTRQVTPMGPEES